MEDRLAPSVTLSNPGATFNYDGDPVNLSVTAVDSDNNPVTFGASSLPAGLGIDSGTGVISGTIASNADASGPYSATVTATDSTTSVSASQTFTWTVAAHSMTLTNPGAQTSHDGDAVDLQLNANHDGYGGGMDFSVLGLPPGLTMSSEGIISGTIDSDADTSSPYSVTATATTDSGVTLSATQTFSWTVSPTTVTLTNPGPQSGYDGGTISLQLSAADSAGHALTYSVDGGSLPDGLSLDSSSGIISGTIVSGADTSSPYSVSVTASDSPLMISDTQTFIWTVTDAVSWSNPADITYGTALGSGQLDATSSVAGTFSYSPAAGTVLGAGAGQTLSVTFTPTDTTDYATETANVSINVDQATPEITWSTPANITYGTTLGSTQLDASASVAGTFTYSPAAGTLLDAGAAQTLSVSFTPTDSTDYTTATASVSINVDQASSATTTLGDGPFTYDGTTQSGGAGTVSGAGSLSTGATLLTYSGNPIDVGTYYVTAHYAGDANHTGSVGEPVAITIVPATLTVSGITADDRTYDGTTGVTLFTSGAALNGAVSGDTGITVNTSGAAGTFASPDVASGIAVQVAGVTFGGTTQDGTAASVDYTLTQPATTASINQAVLIVTGITASDRTYDGTTPATLNWTGAALSGAVSGDTSITLITSGASGNFASPDVASGITVHVAGAFLGGTTQDGTTASVDYTLDQPTTPASITQAVLTVTGVTANNKTYDGTLPAILVTSGASLAGAVSGDTGITLDTSGATGAFATAGVASGITVQVASITFGGTTQDGTAAAVDYSLTQPTTTANITQATPTITWSNPADTTNLTPLGSNQLNATPSVAGSLSYSPPAGTVLSAGSGQTLSVTFTPTDTTDYTTATANATINVIHAPSVFFDSGDYSPDPDGTVTITVELSKVSPQDVTAQYATSNGTADAGVDYTAATGTVRIPAGQTSATFTVSTLDDADATEGMIFNLTLSNPTNAKLGLTSQAYFSQTGVSTFVDLPADVDDTVSLNDLYGQIQGNLGTIGSLVAPAQTAAGLSTPNVVDLGGYASQAWTSAGQIVDEANAAIAASQGEFFRVAGVQAKLQSLISKLNAISSALTTAIGKYAANSEQARTLGQYRNRVIAAATAAGTAYTNAFTDAPAVPPDAVDLDEIDQLNAIFLDFGSVALDVTIAAAAMDADLADMTDIINVEAGEDSNYWADMADLGNAVAAICTYTKGPYTPNVSDGDERDYSAKALAEEAYAVDGVSDDSFAKAGIRSSTLYFYYGLRYYGGQNGSLQAQINLLNNFDEDGGAVADLQGMQGQLLTAAAAL